MSLRRYREAVEELERAVKADPRHPQPHLLLSQVYFRRGDEEAARREKRISLRLRRENPEAMEAPVGRPFSAEPRSGSERRPGSHVPVRTRQRGWYTFRSCETPG